jgi:DNA-binding protein HU-beta
MSINKKELAVYVAANNGLSKKTSEKIIDDIFEFIAASLAEGDEVNIKDFGKFQSRSKAARTGRNPSTGAAVEIAAKNAPGFKPSNALKAKLNS